MTQTFSLWLFCISLSFCSCSTYKNIPYFQDINRDSVTVQEILNSSPLTIHANDILGINVISLSQDASALFNSNLNRTTGNNYDNSAANPVIGYLVDQHGYIEVPLIGPVEAQGLTTNELSNLLKEKLSPYLKEGVVSVRVLNFKISVLGDVLRPNVYKVENEKISINEALSLAGDLNITAMRKNVMLIREENGKRLSIPIDLTTKGYMESKYYYLRNNDILYVQPDKTKFATVDRGYKTTSLILSALTVIAIAIANIYR
ncbi:MAG TPA: polysaccharide biosynthesis/export family protein [Flavitalea sp.]|nr:polysaccharide biosynthesis/export family protein [Flavitalea sp.]